MDIIGYHQTQSSSYKVSLHDQPSLEQTWRDILHPSLSKFFTPSPQASHSWWVIIVLMPCFFCMRGRSKWTLVSLVSGDSLNRPWGTPRLSTPYQYRGLCGWHLKCHSLKSRPRHPGTSKDTADRRCWVAAPSQAPKIILVQIYGFSGIDFCGLWYLPHRYGCDFWILLASWAKSWTIGVYFLKRIFWGSKRPYMCRRLTDFSGAVMCSGTTLPGSESQLQPQSQWSHEPWEA